MDRLFIDLETYSDIDLKKAGLYRYVSSPAFQVLLFAYSLNDAPVRVVDLTEERFLPREVLARLFDAGTKKHAYNAAFEISCLARYFGIRAEEWASQWEDTQLKAMHCGYPSSLEGAGKALGLSADRQKMGVGKALIHYFCGPCSPTKKNGGRTRNLPQHDPDKWALFKEYNARDVETEMEIDRRLRRFPVPEAVEKQWQTDLRINLRGVMADLELVAGAREIDSEVRSELLEEAKRITGLGNPNSVSQLMRWLEEETGDGPADLTKGTVKELLAAQLPSDAARRMLEIRQELGKTSVKKYDALAYAVCPDGRVRGILQFYGANRTGRWAGRIVQPQNLPRTYIRGDLLPLAREMVKGRNRAGLRWTFGSVPDTLSQLIRTALVASPGNRLVDADFSAIEARVLAWLAGEAWRLEVFRTHGKIYEASASQMFNVPLERIKKGNPEYELRQRGKVAELALGYGGGVAAMRNMDTGRILAGVPDEEVKEIVYQWREKSPAIPELWREAESCAAAAVRSGTRSDIPRAGLSFALEEDPENNLSFLTIRLPSGRKLYYAQPHMGVNRFGRAAVCYMGVNQTSGKWESTETYGGKLVENITQAVARDCLAEAVERLEAAGYPVVLHVHDEVVIDAPPGSDRLEDVLAIMRQVPAWAAGLPLNADGWTDAFYKKD
jgi:DNA polymerase